MCALPDVNVVELACHQVDIPVQGGQYAMSGGRRYDTFASTIVKVTASDGTCGYGETSTLGSDYLDGFIGSVQATVRELAPLVMRADVFDALGLVRDMDRAMRGHYPGKAVLDMAMWDLRGRLLGVPVGTLLGGITQDRLGAFMAVKIGSVEAMIAEAEQLVADGYRRIQIKVGDDPMNDAAKVRAVREVLPSDLRYLSCDANRGWTVGQTLRFVRELGDLDTYIEQPCESLTELAAVRAAINRPMVIDEGAKQPRDLLDAVALGCANAMNLKPTRVGGLTKAARMRDIAEEAGLMLTVDEPMGGILAIAGVTQLAATVDPSRLLASVYFGDQLPDLSHIKGDIPRFADGEVTVPRSPGFGFEPTPQDLGTLVFTHRAGDDR